MLKINFVELSYSNGLSLLEKKEKNKFQNLHFKTMQISLFPLHFIKFNSLLFDCKPILDPSKMVREKPIKNELNKHHFEKNKNCDKKLCNTSSN